MSNDTNYDLEFVCPTQEMLEQVIIHLHRKKARWDAWSQRGKDSHELMERTGAKDAAAVVSWGFDFDDIQVDDDGEASVKATAWANENIGNIHISGEQGELADLLQKFPFLEISGSYKDEYARGSIEGSEKC